MGLSADADCGATGAAAVSCASKKITLIIKSSTYSVTTVGGLTSSTESYCSLQATVVNAAAPYTATFADLSLAGTNCATISTLIDTGKIVMMAQQFAAADGTTFEKTLVLPVATGFTTGVSMAKTALLSQVITTAGSETVTTSLTGTQLGAVSCPVFNLVF